MKFTYISKDGTSDTIECESVSGRIDNGRANYLHVQLSPPGTRPDSFFQIHLGPAPKNCHRCFIRNAYDGEWLCSWCKKGALNATNLH